MSWHDLTLESYFLEANENLLNACLGHVVAHSIKGRVRVSIPLLTSRKELTFCLSFILSTREGIERVTSNHHCGSATIYYNTDTIEEKALLEQIASTTIRDLIQVRGQVRDALEESCSDALRNLKKASVGVGLSIVCTGTAFPIVAAVDIYLFLITFPIYRRAFRNLFHERRFTFDLLYFIPLTIGLLLGEILISSIAIWFTYFGDFISELTTPGSKHRIQRLEHMEHEDGSQKDKNWFMRVLAGLTTLAVGIVLIPLPGPGIVVTGVALQMLAPEFPWAKRLNGKMNSVVSKTATEQSKVVDIR